MTLTYRLSNRQRKSLLVRRDEGRILLALPLGNDQDRHDADRRPREVLARLLPESRDWPQLVRQCDAGEVYVGMPPLSEEGAVGVLGRIGPIGVAHCVVVLLCWLGAPLQQGEGKLPQWPGEILEDGKPIEFE